MNTGTPWNRRRVLAGLGIAAAAPILAQPIASLAAYADDDGLLVVDDGTAAAVVVISDTPNVQERSAAQELVRQIAASTGVQLALLTASTVGSTSLNRIHIGFTTDATRSAVQQQISGLDADGFSFTVVDNILTIVGPSPWGTRFGVYEFLERFAGVRWLLPGPDGHDTPPRRTIGVPRVSVRNEPAIMSRNIYPFGQGNTWDSANPFYKWSALNRTHERMSFSHNLGVIFAPETYADPSKPATFHPEYYPIINGSLYLPRPGVRTGWQPRFTEPSTVDVAAAAAIAAFDADPTLLSFPLGINDNSGFSDEYYDLNSLNLYGGYSVSDTYYQWINAVAERVAAIHPNRYLGLLAYNEVADAPSFRLHPMVVPYITRDRYGWVDPATKAADIRRHARWEEMASSFGWWDYPWGAPFSSPRMYGNAMADAYRYAASHRVLGVFGEAEQSWGEGPKMWIYAKLLWNPEQSAERLLAEWCQRAAGNRAAPDLIAYFRAWESFWTTTATKLPWFRAGYSAMYFNYIDPSPAAVVGEELIATCRIHLESAYAKAATAPQKARVTLLLRAFEYYEASVLSYPQHITRPTNGADALALLTHTVDRVDATASHAARREELLVELAADPILKQGFDAKKVGLVWPKWNLVALWEIAQYIRINEPTGGPVRDKVLAIRQATQSAEVSGYCDLLIALAENRVVQRALNPSFGPDTDPWLIEFAHRPGEPPRIVDDIALDGGTSLRVVGPTGSGGVSQQIAVQPGYLRASFMYYTDVTPADYGTIVPTWLAYDSAGKLLQIYRGESRPLRDSQGRWAELAMAQLIPAGTATVRCYLSLLGFSKDTAVYIDNASFIQIQGQ